MSRTRKRVLYHPLIVGAYLLIILLCFRSDSGISILSIHIDEYAIRIASLNRGY
jgi:hypothetical protein